MDISNIFTGIIVAIFIIYLVKKFGRILERYEDIMNRLDDFLKSKGHGSPYDEE